MGIKLINEIMDCPIRMTLPEWKAMMILAEDANDALRITWSQVTSKKITDRLELTPHTWTNLRGDLVRKGLLEVAEAGRKGRCAKYRFPQYGSKRQPAKTVPEQMSPPAEDESGAFHPLAEDANAECVLQEVTPTPQCNSSDQIHSPFAGVAPATPIGSHSDQGGITADAATEPRESRSRSEPKKKTRGEPVTPERRAECNDYIALLLHLDEEDVFSVIEELWDDKWSMWIWAYNLMAKAHGLPKVPKDDEGEYREPETLEQALMVYVKALRLSSKNVEWELILTGPLDELAFKSHHQQPPAWAA